MPRILLPESVPPMKSEDMVYDLVKMPKVLRRLAGQPIEWHPLATALLAVGPEETVPTGKQLQQALEIAPSKFRRWLDALYAAYLGVLGAEGAPLDFPRAQHQLLLTGKRASAVFNCCLPVTPRVGEQLHLDFLRAVTGESTFYVDSLAHDFSGENYLILVYLRPGYYNGYRQQLQHRAKFEETISLHVQLRAPDYLLDDLLLERYPPPTESAEAYELSEKAEARYGSKSILGGRRHARF